MHNPFTHLKDLDLWPLMEDICKRNNNGNICGYLLDMYCNVISEHRKWAVRRVLPSQRDKSLRKQLPDIAESVSMRSKNFATVGWLRSETSNKPKTNSLDGRTCARKIPEEMFYCTATIRICFT